MVDSFQNRNRGWIEAITGSMFSGKTEELIRRLRRAQLAKQKVQVFKPKIDERYSSGEVTSHSDQRIPSLVVGNSRDILEHLKDTTRVVGVDEVQFFDDHVVDVLQKLANRGMRVIAAGLDTDWKGEPFGPVPKMMAVADMVTKQNAICMQCGAPASRTQRTVNSQDDVLVGAQDAYEARCRQCHDPHLKIEEQLQAHPRPKRENID